jgi:hypothetical protein
MIMFVHALAGVLTALPPISPNIPPGSTQILGVVGNIKWIAGISLLAGFFGGLIAWVGGRLVDHHRFGRLGMIMMLSALAGGVLYGIGYQLINYFAGSGG